VPTARSQAVKSRAIFDNQHRTAQFDQVLTLELAECACNISASEKLAKLLLEFAVGGKETKDGTCVNFALTHEEIAEFIGTTRETVTRTLSEFKSQHLVELRGSMLVIEDRAALEEFVTA
jgi:CRP/FNR family transcriptional regulator, cyclic AMP receptor protein